MLTLKEISVLADFCYLAETAKEGGAGIPGSAWEVLWKEFQGKNTCWAGVVNKADKLGFVGSSNICFQMLEKRG